MQCAGAIAASVVVNVVLTLRYPASHRLTNRGATGYLGFDVLQLAALLYLTGGIMNPFALMFLAAGGDRGRDAQSRQHADPRRHRLHLGLSDLGVPQAAALGGGRGAGPADAVPGGHLGLAGDRHRIHLDLFLAHRERRRADVGGPGGDAARAVARASPGLDRRAGDRGGA
ncbi:MAG: hypothetical protein WDM81_15710 [Rhizomicrobium sp.]